jgi:tetratricopeptide (TPR) repeat protein
MAFNKNKALESALKYLNQGKPAQAIGEYKQILRHDAKDQATLMTVGDLFARQGDMPQAIEYFERLAQVYLGDGFNSKAIAIYKKIAKLAPNELPPLERLADLYVQQGVLSEARPLFLQIAEAHLKANRAPKAVEVLNRLLEVEPDNPRVQMRLAELYNVMGQKKEASQTYFNYSQRLYERGEIEEAQKLIARAMEVDPENPSGLLLEAKIFSSAQKNDKAIAVLAKHPEADAGGEVTNLLVDWQLASGHFEQAADRARNQLLRGSSHFGLMQKVADTLVENGKAVEGLALLTEIREPAIESGEQDKFLKSLSAVTQKYPENIEALEMLADFSRHTSDPFHLNSSLSQLVDAYAASGQYARAEETLQEMIEKNKGDERLQARLEQLRERANGNATDSPEPLPEHASVSTPSAPSEEPASILEASNEIQEPEPLVSPTETVVEEPLDEETQRYVAQALTDVDLFSSYGLTQKATLLLESVLERVPRHTPTLERLLDLYLGAANNRRTAEVAAQLEQIHRERGDNSNADHFAELRQRYEKAAGLSKEDLPPAAAATAPAASAAMTQEVESADVQTAAPAPPASVVEFEIPVSPAEPEAQHEGPAVDEAASTPAAKPLAPEIQEPQPAVPTEEVDLSDEWEAMVQEVSEPAKPVEDPPKETAPASEPAPAEPVAAEPAAAEAAAEPAAAEAAAEPTETPAESTPEPAEIPLAESGKPEDSRIELVLEPSQEEPAGVEAESSASSEIELELNPAHAETHEKAETKPKTADDFLSELTAELEDSETPSPAEPEPAAPKAEAPAARQAPPPPAPAPPAPQAPAAATPPAPVAPPEPELVGAAPEASAESLNQLAEVFQEFRSELGEMGDEDEDLETHYNLGIAYREMGLLDEAIGEFQKVAQAVQRGKPFPYAMNCAAMLALSFMDKGEPKIAAMWYERALKTPGLDQDAVLALRYDLGLSLESAGESESALDHFRQVYATNIDYRDVADRIAMLQKH